MFQNLQKMNHYLGKQNWTKLIQEGNEKLIRFMHSKGIVTG